MTLRDGTQRPGDRSGAGISPSAVWRYEEAKRTPSLRTIETLVAALSSTTGLAPHASEWRDALRTIAAMGPEFEEFIYRSVDELPHRSARERIHEGLDRLGDRELDALAELVDDPDALPALASWASADPLGPVRDALNPVRDALGGGDGSRGGAARACAHPFHRPTASPGR